MRIRFENNERNIIEKFSLPVGTYLIEVGSDDNAKFLWQVDKNGKWKQLVDYDEYYRPWNEGEEEKYIEALKASGNLKDEVLKFFIANHDDLGAYDASYRKYDTFMCLWEELFKYIRPSGACIEDDDGNYLYEIFNLFITKTTNVKEANDELTDVFKRIKKVYSKNLKQIEFGLINPVDSDNVFYTLVWEFDKKFIVYKSHISKRIELKSFLTLKSAIKFIKENIPAPTYTNEIQGSYN